ncbi:MAG: isochorismatase family cysteine hydrolase [Candidatus Paceibacterota bacterium]|jgi:nicotinamidase-related amidase
MKKALIIIDIQKGFINKLTNKIPSRIRSFILRNRGKYNLIIFTKYMNRKNSNFVKNLNWKGFMDDKQTAIIDELKEFINNKNLYKKYTYGSFVDNKLLKYLKRNKIKQVDLAGIDTENCVLTFARDAFDRGFRVVVFKNLSASHSNIKLHKAALKIIEENIGNVI